MWQLAYGPRYENRLKKFAKKHGEETRAVHENLDTYFASLNAGVKPMQLVKESWVHNEQMGIHAIDQSPLGKGSLETRLYVFPEESTTTLYVMTIGDKDQQKDDVRECCALVKKLRSAKQEKK
jgi:hypothetical protein